jgi:hypothetical protein
MVKRNLLNIIALSSIALSVFISGCGSSNDGSMQYTGNKNQATITADNAQSISEDVLVSSIDSKDLTPDVSGMTKGTGSLAGPRPCKLTSDVINLLKDAYDPSAKSSGTSESSDTVSGSCGGQLTYHRVLNIASGEFEISLDYSRYCDGEFSIDGKMEASGKLELLNGTNIVHYTMNVSFSRLAMTDDESVSRTLDGTIDMDGTETEYHLAVDIVEKDNNTDKTYWMNDFTIDVTFTLLTLTTTLDIQGRYYDYDNGYVDVNTSRTISIFGNPRSGELTIEGSHNSSSILICASAYYTVQADTDGDGQYDDYVSAHITWE